MVKMDLVIKPLCQQLADDYFSFFENAAFTDDSPYRCYCQIYQMGKKEYNLAAASPSLQQNPGLASRRIAAEQIANSLLRGYLAYLDGQVIAWCNANDRANYPADQIDDQPFNLAKKGQEIAVVCFQVAPQHRQKGVASQLLERVLVDAKSSGYQAVAAFPVIRSVRFEWDSPGPVRLYEKMGFVTTGPQVSVSP